MILLETEQKADDIITLFQQHGGDAYYGEPVTQLQHACQAATRGMPTTYNWLRNCFKTPIVAPTWERHLQVLKQFLRN